MSASPGRHAVGPSTSRAAILSLGMTAGGCHAYRLLETRSPEADAIAQLWWILLAATGIPAVIAIVVLLVAALRTPGRAAPFGDTPRQTWTILIFGGVMPLAIVFALLGQSVRTGTRVSVLDAPRTLTIDVVGRQFWWEVRYPDHDIVTANELHIPVGRPVRLRITSGDVIHSFWVPRLHGKRDMVPGRVDELWLQSDQAGVYRGQCAEFCGLQHALMAFEVVANDSKAFDDWVRLHQRPAVEPGDALAVRGLGVFHRAQCGHCHTIKGITTESAAGVVGPDLTHLASRRTLGAGLLANNRGNLGGWILHPQSLKPGNNMPASSLPPDDLHALLHFLETLR